MHILICSVGDQHYGFDLAQVESSILAVEVTPVPNGPSHVMGAINIHGTIMPVFNIRSLLGLPSNEMQVNDHFVVCRSEERSVAFWVDRVKMVRLCRDDELVPGTEVMPHLDTIRYALKEEGQITLIFDLDRLVRSSGKAANQ